MLTRLRNGAFVVAVMTAVALFATATPASATTFSGLCYGNNESSIWLEALASYSTDGSWDHWYSVAGVISNDPFRPGSDLGDQNNIDLYLYQDGAQNWTSFSPDSMSIGEIWAANPNRYFPIISNVQARATGIFDKWLAPDPRCSWYSPIA